MGVAIMAEPLLDLVDAELSEIARSGKCDRRPTYAQLAQYVGLSNAQMSYLLHGRHPHSAAIPVRVACALGCGVDRAMELVRATGWDISSDWSPHCKHYRDAISAHGLDRKNAELSKAGASIAGVFRR